MSSSTSDVVGLGFAFLFQIVVGTACFIGFCILRPLNRQVYESKVKNSTVLDSGFWAWISPIWHVDEGRRAGEMGLDAVMLLKFISIGCKLFTVLTLPSIGLIIVHIYAPSLVRGVRPKFMNLQGLIIQNPSLVVLSMTHIPHFSPIFYLHTALAYLYSLYCMYLLHQTWKEYVELRKDYFASPEYKNALYNRTLLFTYMPKSLQDVAKFSMYLKPFSADSAPKQILFGREYLELPVLIKEHKRLTKELERILYSYLKNTRRNGRVYHYEGIPLFSRRVDTIDYYKARLHDLEYRIYHARSRADESFKPDASCFVEFEDTLVAHTVASQLKRAANFSWKEGRLTGDKRPPKSSICPPFADIIWNSIGLTRIQKLQRKGICFFFLCGLFLIWLIFQSFVTTLSSIETWRALGDNVERFIANSRVLVIFVQSFLTPILMALLNYVLPFALRAVSRVQGLLTFTTVEKSTLFKYFLFQVMLVLVHITFSFVPSMILSIVNGERPSTTFSMFITNLLDNFVSLSTTYISYMITGFTYFGLELIQGASLFLAVYRTFLERTPREQQALDVAPAVQFVTIYGFLLFIFLLGISYSLVAPLIVPFTAVSFLLAYVVMKYQLMYVYDVKIESGGTWWPKVFSYLCFSLALFQLCTLGAILCVGSQASSLALLHDDSIFVVLLIGLPIVTIFFYYYSLSEFRQKSEFLDGTNYSFVTSSPDSAGKGESSKPPLLMQRVFNPVAFGPLAQIWLQPQMQQFVPALYNPAFENDLEYMKSVNPSLVERLEKEYLARQEQTNTSKSLKKRSLAAFVFSVRASQKLSSSTTDSERKSLLDKV